MSQSKEKYTDLQAEYANRSNPEFQHHVQMLKNQPSASDLRQSALNAFDSMMGEFGISTHGQTLLRGLLLNYAECERIIAEDKAAQPICPIPDHCLMIGRDKNKVVS